jgi:hypothetical protein
MLGLLKRAYPDIDAMRAWQDWSERRAALAGKRSGA